MKVQLSLLFRSSKGSHLKVVSAAKPVGKNDPTFPSISIMCVRSQIAKNNLRFEVFMVGARFQRRQHEIILTLV